MELEVRAIAEDGRTVVMTAAQSNAINQMNNTRKGGCASVIGYCPESNWEDDHRPIQDIQFISHFSTKKLYERRLKALLAITYADVATKVAQDEKFGKKTAGECLEIFNTRKGKLVDSIKRNLDDSPKNAQAEAHVRCYAYIGDQKVHLATVSEKVPGENPIQVPIPNDDGSVTVKSIMVPYLELNVKTRVEGVRKTVKSGAPVLMEKFIKGALNKRSINYRTLSLKDDNFEAYRVDHQEFLPEHVTRFGDFLDG